MAATYAVVTGAGRGLGRALATQLASAGTVVAVCDVNLASAEETLELIRRAGGSGEAHSLDVTQPASWEALRDKLQAGWPALDWLVNNAGVVASGEIGTLPLTDARWMLETNLWGVICGCHTFVPWLKRNERGARVLNIASIAGLVGAPMMGGYCLTKAAVVSLSETLHAELRSAGVSVTVACPNFFSTGLLAAGRFSRPCEREEAERRAQKSRASADDVARTVLRAAHRRRLYVVTPLVARSWWWTKRLSPSLLAYRVARWYARWQREQGLGA